MGQWQTSMKPNKAPQIERLYRFDRSSYWTEIPSLDASYRVHFQLLWFLCITEFPMDFSATHQFTHSNGIWNTTNIWTLKCMIPMQKNQLQICKDLFLFFFGRYVMAECCSIQRVRYEILNVFSSYWLLLISELNAWNHEFTILRVLLADCVFLKIYVVGESSNVQLTNICILSRQFNWLISLTVIAIIYGE